ncbi:MAG: acetyl-CoA carboxylase biotin carboxylase subunit [Panacagrimonas sp.]|jgi:acetyl-CoA carboxylase biotin carboxylase subunit|nr:biotin carboxylase N-terminal domain-containing protein [Panacagrimonas sp.]MCC2655223.1 acetyl-CoA carboxylase biotin carboxylase subunit [Panacagrimonas sp.]
MKRLLIANRGEIALRIVRAAHALGIESVLAASAADKDSLAAREADRTVVLGPAKASLSYLDPKLVVHAAKATGCDALHPGYGFLSERTALVTLCEDNGIAFVGPTATSMDQVGGKIAARELAAGAGVPLVPGSGALASADEALAFAETVGFPVVTKASAGGGGRGMVVAHSAAELREGFERASHEAKEAFGDGTLFLERFVQTARHIEVQVMGDGNGKVLHFGERDCSAQRRYQKMVEEAPGAILPDAVRARLHESAVRLLSSIKYRNAGTVEFLYDVERQAFYFIEVNARIQVEHPVSEQICGVDLIQMQLRVAGGEPLALEQQDIQRRGHAIEVRVIAEDPERNFAPSPGRITRWVPPVGDGVRLDSAMFEGAMVPPFYDSMIAKLIVSGSDRATTVTRLQRALDAFVIDGIATNLRLLRHIAAHPDFIENRISTRWLEQTLLPSFARG